MEADWLSRTLSSIPNFDQIYLLAKDCRDALTTICKKIAGKLVQENALLKENNGLGCFLTLSNEADRLCGWIASLNDADLLKEALQTVITQSEDTEMKTDDKVAASFAQHATLSLLLLAAYLEQLEQRFGIDETSRVEHALSFAQSVLPDGVSEQTIIRILSKSELAPSRPVDGFELEETVQGVTAAMDCLSSWKTVLELFQCEGANGIELDDTFRLGDKLEKLMAKDEAAPTKPLVAPRPPLGRSAKQEQSIDLTTEAKPLQQSVDEDDVKRKKSQRTSYPNSTKEEFSYLP